MEVAKQQGLANYLSIRGLSYDILRIIFLKEPSKRLLNTLQDRELMGNPPFREEHPLIKEGLNTIKLFFEQNRINKIYDKLHWDYTRMFIGPGILPAPPWESAYLNEDKLLFQRETLLVRKAYLKHNFLPSSLGEQADDHLGLELDFLFQMNKLTIESFESNDEKKYTLIQDQVSFLNNHLLRWVPLFKERVLAHAEFDFYKGAVKILQGFLEIDKVILEGFLTEKSIQIN